MGLPYGVTAANTPEKAARLAPNGGEPPAREHLCYSAAYFFMYSAIGAYMLLPLVLIQHGLTRPETGYLSALFAGAGALTQVAMGRLSDRLEMRRPFVVIPSVLLAACFAAFLRPGGFGAYAALYFLAGSAFHAAGTAVTAAIADWSSASKRTATAFGRARLWGSAGFVAALLALSRWASNDAVIAGWAAASFLLMGVSMGFARESRQHVPAAMGVPSRATGMLRDRNLLLFLVCFLLFKLAESAANAFVALRLDQLGGSRTLIAWALAVNAIAEIPLLGLAGPLSERLGRRPVLLIAFLVLPVRMAAYALIPGAWWVFPVQLFHGFTFGFMSVASVAYVADRAPDDLRATAQGFLGMAMALGMCGGPLLAGIVVQITGSMPAMFAALGFAAAVGAALFATFVGESLSIRQKPGAGPFRRIAAAPVIGLRK